MPSRGEAAGFFPYFFMSTFSWPADLSHSNAQNQSILAMPNAEVSQHCPPPKQTYSTQHPKYAGQCPPRSVYLPWDIPKPKCFAHTRWKSSISRQCPGGAGRRGEVAGGRAVHNELHHPQPTSEFSSLRQSTHHSTKRNLEQGAITLYSYCHHRC